MTVEGTTWYHTGTKEHFYKEKCLCGRETNVKRDSWFCFRTHKFSAKRKPTFLTLSLLMSPSPALPHVQASPCSLEKTTALEEKVLNFSWLLIFNFFSFHILGAIPGGTPSLLLVCSQKFLCVELGGIPGVLRIKAESAEYKASALLSVLLHVPGFWFYTNEILYHPVMLCQ